MISPLAAMIDKACGVPANWKPRPPQKLPQVIACRKCKVEKGCRRDRSDPRGARRIVFTCPKCGGGGSIEYFDKDGKRLHA